MNSPLAHRLRSARQAANLTQQQLGIRLGMDPNTASARMNQYEKGKHAPDYQTAKRMADELGVPVAYLYCDDDMLAELICVIAKLKESEKAELLEKLR
ncbi:helix-turn-helix transcriptional regulator [Neptunomonas qingdaonensis]|uniref:Helix-turn-helix domain-containing protein n=1 Tax=Neptunomonas qingdaonensis TaxID=1045558 RepID=A0A1I2TNJ6_9GAMM|nr:helix-turn-helix transcriptional regulator [Neptunomonas qingdaonensis]SFG66458.1 Helix-turn-helix domain-containing protein [Neptunomonas qingdaonensis]